MTDAAKSSLQSLAYFAAGIAAAWTGHPWVALLAGMSAGVILTGAAYRIRYRDKWVVQETSRDASGLVVKREWTLRGESQSHSTGVSITEPSGDGTNTRTLRISGSKPKD
jgi:hypothetical protein